jgi:hypothetical protein
MYAQILLGPIQLIIALIVSYSYYKKLSPRLQKGIIIYWSSVVVSLAIAYFSWLDYRANDFAIITLFVIPHAYCLLFCEVNLLHYKILKHYTAMKKIVIAAGTGFLGQVLVNQFKNRVTDIVVLTRGKAKTVSNVRYINWDAKTMTGWQSELEGADALINLAGKSVDCRYNERNKSEIMASRVDSTTLLNKAVLGCKKPPAHWLNSSTATIYRHSLGKQMDEETGETGFDFSMNVAKMWERAFFMTKTPMTLKTALRTSIVLGKNGGAYPILKRLAQVGFGGRQGNGKQFVSWIHEHDFSRAVEFILTKQVTGVVNIVSPAPTRNADFMKAVRKQVNMPLGIPLGKKLLAIGAAIIGTETELILKSRNVIPVRLQQAGFQFKYGNLHEALGNL